MYMCEAVGPRWLPMIPMMSIIVGNQTQRKQILALARKYRRRINVTVKPEMFIPDYKYDIA
jgi:hypothetical protein